MSLDSLQYGSVFSPTKRWMDERFGSHGDDGAGGRTNKDQSLLLELLRKLGILAKESIPRVDSLTPSVSTDLGTTRGNVPALH